MHKNYFYAYQYTNMRDIQLIDIAKNDYIEKINIINKIIKYVFITFKHKKVKNFHLVDNIKKYKETNNNHDQNEYLSRSDKNHNDQNNKTE